jgi:CheY-like chemotaxis protein
MAHILVIDDDKAVREVFEKFLEHFGHMVTLAVNGREGLRLFQQEKADIVITDIFMPDMDGLEVILEIRKRCAAAPNKIPIIAMSGGIVVSDVHPISFLNQAELFGAARTFLKPINFHGMLAAIRELLPATGMAN